MSNPLSYTITSGRLRVVFERRADRWAHRVDMIPAGGAAVPLFASVEGVLDSSSQPSPPIQELQPHDDGRTLLGVGMAGRNHWSLTCGVRQVDGSPHYGESVWVEVACRVKGDIPFLASTYRVVDGINASTLNDESIELSAASHGVRVRTPDATASITDSGFALRVRYVHQNTSTTARWSYSIGTSISKSLAENVNQ